MGARRNFFQEGDQIQSVHGEGVEADRDNGIIESMFLKTIFLLFEKNTFTETRFPFDFSHG